MGLVPANIDSQTSISDIAELYVNDLPSSQCLDIEYKRWQRKWDSHDDKPSSLQEALLVLFLYLINKSGSTLVTSLSYKN